jgi:hypothetical protein
MKVFLSWSEERSRLAAAAFKKWIEEVLQCVEPWMSPDIEKGANWPAELTERLGETYVGVVFLTRENLSSPWLHFEAGALAKTTSGRPCVVLLDVSPTDVRGPLSMYQLTRCTEDDFRRLVQNLRTWAEREGGKVIPVNTLDALFKRSWPELKNSLEDIRSDAKNTGPVLSEEEIGRETLMVVRSLRAEIVSLRADIVDARTAAPAPLGRPPVEGLFRIRKDMPSEQVDGMLAESAVAFPHLRFSRTGEILLVIADDDSQSRGEWAAWRRRYGTMVFAPAPE